MPIELNDNSQLGISSKIICGDSRIELAKFKGQVDLIVTSPPYADARRRHYDSVHPDDYVEWFMTFHEAFFEALKPTGSLVINIKGRIVNGVRHRYVWHTIEALGERGWLSIDDYIWHKSNPMPGYWPTRLSDGWEYCFHLAKERKPFFNHEAIKKPIGDWADTRLKNLSESDLERHNSINASGFGRDISKWVGKKKVLPSNVITSAVVGKNKRHPAVYPTSIPEFFIKLLSPAGGLVVDPFAGSGSTGVAALSLGRNSVLIDNQPSYCQVAAERLKEEAAAQIVEEEVMKGISEKMHLKPEIAPQLRLLEKMVS
ncbi:MAG: site-specific DNA-methyltransferase [Chloroflexota bacterium]|nr:site-specific DNA-methyltransferase [Chloroflexota bacterium]